MPRPKKSKLQNLSGEDKLSSPEVIKLEEIENDTNSVNVSDLMQEALIAIRAKDARSKSVNKISQAFMTLDDIPQDTDLPLIHFPLQYVFGRKCFKPGILIEIIGPEHVGKTTMLFNLFGIFMLACPNIPVLYVNTEGRNKLFNMDRLKRCLSSDKNIAEKFSKQMLMFEGHAQKETLEAIDSWCKIQRDIMTKNGIPETTPILVGVDTLSKLMPKSEALNLGYGTTSGETGKGKGLGESSNLEFSKLLQEWCRSRVDFLEKYNVFMIVVSHQNTKINMNSFMARPVSDANNKTKIGGNSINQSAAVQFTLTRTETKLDANTKDAISHIIKLNVVKNSIGPDKRSIQYALRVSGMQDTDDYQEPSIDFNYGLGEIFVAKGLLGVSFPTLTKVTSTELGLTKVSREEFAKAFNEDKSLVDKMGMELGIYGYVPNMLDPQLSKSNLEIAKEEIVDSSELEASLSQDDSFSSVLEDEDINSEGETNADL